MTVLMNLLCKNDKIFEFQRVCLVDARYEQFSISAPDSPKSENIPLASGARSEAKKGMCMGN